MISPQEFFLHPTHPTHRRYEVLRALYVDKCAPAEVAKRMSYSIHMIRAIKRDFDRAMKRGQMNAEHFFITYHAGRKSDPDKGRAKERIIQLRKRYYSILDIKTVLDTEGYEVSHDYIHRLLVAEGFSRLPKRTQIEKKRVSSILIKAPRTKPIDWDEDTGRTFYSERGTGVLPFLPVLASLNVEQWIRKGDYPQTEELNRVQNVISFIALKLSGHQRYSHDDLWAMDRGLGLFSGLNVLPKDTTLSTYSYRIDRTMNRLFLKAMFDHFKSSGDIGQTMNLDFTAIPHWGNASVLENNWSGKRGKSLKSILAVLCQHPDTGLFCYSDAEVRHDRQPDCVLQFVDFWREGGESPACLIFDSKFTTYENLEKLDQENIKFITLRRRGKNLVEAFERMPSEEKQKVRIEGNDRKYKTVSVYDSEIVLPETDCMVRQIIVSDHGREKPAFIITNDTERSAAEIIRQYGRRWNVEKGISEQVQFFHLNRLSSSIVVKVDFDLTMTVACHNFYRVMAQRLTGFEKETALSLNNKFFQNAGMITIKEDSIIVKMKKKRHLPILINALKPYEHTRISWLGNRKLEFRLWATS